ncbi:MAG: hypothetical protein AAGI51_03940 [Pseudomonadota bacterium]
MNGILSSDGAWAVVGDVILQNTTWGRFDWRTGDHLVNGEDFTQTIEYGGAITDGVRMEWDWPRPEPRRVLSYPELIAGRKPWLPETAGTALPVAADAADGLTASWALDWGGGGGFNVAFDLWLTTEPGGGPESIAQEVMIWLKPGEGRPAGRIVTEVTFGETVFDLWVKDGPHGGLGWSYAAFVARGELASGSLDMGDVMAALDAAGALQDGLWLSTVELGAEVTGGAGWMQVSDFSVTFGDAPMERAGTEAVGGAAAERLVGDAGADALRGRDGADSLEGRGGDDALWGGSQDDRVWGGEGGDAVHGGEGADRLFGGAGDDRVFGDAGDDALFGGQGADALDGARGADVIDGGPGADRLRGGPGPDVFVPSPGAVDVIADFESGDAIDLSAWGEGSAELIALRRGAELRLDGETVAILPRRDAAEWSVIDMLA